MTEPLLAVEALDAGYDAVQALFGVSLTVDAGEVVLLAGRNGAGKSTTLKTIMGLVRPRAGRVRFAGREVAGLEAHRISRLGLGWVPEDRRVFADLSVLENLEVGRQPPRLGRDGWTPAKLLDLFPNLGTMRGRPAGRMSGGEQQMLAIARTMMGNPLLLLLDEPSEGLAPVILDGLQRALHELRRDGLAVLLAEQNIRFAGRLATRAYQMETGRIISAVDRADRADRLA